MTDISLPVETSGQPLTVYFSTSARIAKLLGRESIANPIIALLELIKNSYDADATEVKIIFENIRSGAGKIRIIDNGIGMTFDDIKTKWMRAATDDKEREPLSKKLKRRKIGEKGIGRFAAERLAKRLILVSKPEGSTEGYCLVINWPDFEEANADFEKVPNKCYPSRKKKGEHGLEIFLEELNEKWNDESIKKLRQDISLIIPPAGQSQKFKVRIISDEFKEVSGEIKSTFLKEADFVFSGRLEKDGTVQYELKTIAGKEYKESDTLKEFACGPLQFVLHFFYLGETPYLIEPGRPRNYQLRRSLLEDFGGIKLYRDNFRVKPFGDAGNDWLGLDQERINNPGVFPGNNQIFGYVKISKDKNPNIVDITTREGVVANPAFIDMVKFIKGSLKFFSKKRAGIEGKAKGMPRKKRKRKKAMSLIKESFRKMKEAPKFAALPTSLVESLPQEIKSICDEINGCLYYGYFTASAIMMRKALEVATIIKFKQENKESLIFQQGEYLELPARIEKAKQKNFISKKISERLIKDNKLKIFGDTAAHSFRIQIRGEDIGPVRDQLRLVLEDMSLKKD